MSCALLGIDEINMVLNDFLKEFGVTAELGSEFAYWIGEDRITYNVLLPETATDYFMDNFNRLAPDIDCDPFLASILHELGHAETLEYMEEVEELYCYKMKHQIEIECQGDCSEEKIKELHQRYFDLPDEHEATMWAIEYIRNNYEKMAKFWDNLREAIMNFYKLNNVDLKEAF